jgi:hypothetical protein
MGSSVVGTRGVGEEVGAAAAAAAFLEEEALAAASLEAAFLALLDLSASGLKTSSAAGAEGAEAAGALAGLEASLRACFSSRRALASACLILRASLYVQSTSHQYGVGRDEVNRRGEKQKGRTCSFWYIALKVSSLTRSASILSRIRWTITRPSSVSGSGLAVMCSS